MMLLITYDVNTEDKEGKTRLRRVAKECVNYGQRVQNSVFECLITPLEFAKLKHRLGKIANPNKDSIRYYRLGVKWESKVEHFGTKVTYNPEGPLIV